MSILKRGENLAEPPVAESQNQKLPQVQPPPSIEVEDRATKAPAQPPTAWADLAEEDISETEQNRVLEPVWTEISPNRAGRTSAIISPPPLALSPSRFSVLAIEESKTMGSTETETLVAPATHCDERRDSEEGEITVDEADDTQRSEKDEEDDMTDFK